MVFFTVTPYFAYGETRTASIAVRLIGRARQITSAAPDAGRVRGRLCVGACLRPGPGGTAAALVIAAVSGCALEDERGARGLFQFGNQDGMPPQKVLNLRGP